MNGRGMNVFIRSGQTAAATACRGQVMLRCGVVLCGAAGPRVGLLRVAAAWLLALMVAGCGGGSTSETGVGAASRDSQPAAAVDSPVNSGNVADRSAAGGLDASLPQAFAFELMGVDTGVDFEQTSGNSPDKPFPGANGTGCGLIDIDLDGRPDLVFANGAKFPIADGETETPDRIYRNRGGWRFSDVTAEVGLVNWGYSCGIATGDLNSDGFPDFYLTRYGVNQLWLSLGDGTYEEVGEEWGVADQRWGTGAAIFDFNRDGIADLYVCNYGQWDWESSLFCGDREKNVRIYCSPSHVPPQGDVFYRGDGSGAMLDVSEATGIALPERRGQGVLAADLNEDGLIDLYVANDIHPNSLFLNLGQRFQEQGELAGIAFDHLGQSQAGMGVAIGDINGDARPDLLVTNYQNEHNALYTSIGEEAWLETGVQSLPGALPWVGWGVVLADFDFDGGADVFVTNGHTDDNLADLSKEGEYLQPAGVWQKTATGFRLVRCRGEYFAEPHAGRGLAAGDLDGDFDADLVVSHQDGKPAILQNRSVDPPRQQLAVQVQLVGTRGHRDARGGVLTAISEAGMQTWFAAAGGSYASASDSQIVLSPAGDGAFDLRIRWPDGSREEFSGLSRGNRIAIVQAIDEAAGSRLIQLPR